MPRLNAARWMFSLILILLLAACNSSGRTASSDTQEAVASVELIQPTPTEEPTPETTPTEVPPIETIPEEFGGISEVEMHNGSLYGIDEYGRAVVVRNENGEWEHFQRPIRIGLSGMYDAEIMSVAGEELAPEDERRILDDNGNTIEYGIIGTRQDEHDTSFTWVDISCYPRGIFMAGRFPVLVIEIPLRYERQIVAMVIPDQGGGLEMNFIPQSRTLSESEPGWVSYYELADGFRTQLAVGNQMILSTEFEDVEDIVFSADYGEGADIPKVIRMGEFWVDGSIFGQ